MKYTLLYIYVAVGMLAIASCSSDDDLRDVPEMPQTAAARESDGPE